MVKFGPKKSKLSVLPENWHIWYLEYADSYSDIVFLNLKIYFWANLGRKSQNCSFWLKIAAQSLSRMLILVPTLLSSVSNAKSIFGQMWEEKFKVHHDLFWLALLSQTNCNILPSKYILWKLLNIWTLLSNSDLIWLSRLERPTQRLLTMSKSIDCWYTIVWTLWLLLLLIKTFKHPISFFL